MKGKFEYTKREGLPGGANEMQQFAKGVFSIEGYKRFSPDVNNPFNIIPSGDITMKDVDFPVHGVDNLGNSQIMYPGNDYKFPGSSVFEIPLRDLDDYEEAELTDEEIADLRAQGYVVEEYQTGGPTEEQIATDPELRDWHKYNTPLTEEEQKAFEEWKVKANIGEWDRGAYDIQGYWKEQVMSPEGDIVDAEGHRPDTYKKPNHPTFSTESKYANEATPGYWDGPKYYAPATHKELYGDDYYAWMRERNIQDGRPEHLAGYMLPEVVITPEYQTGREVNPLPYSIEDMRLGSNLEYERQYVKDNYGNPNKEVADRVLAYMKLIEEADAYQQTLDTQREEDASLEKFVPASDNTRVETRVINPLTPEEKIAADQYAEARKKEQEDFEKRQWEKYDEASTLDAALDRAKAFAVDPLGMTARFITGEQAYFPGMGEGLLNSDNPEYENYLRAVGYTPGEIEASDIQNMLNPMYWGASIGNNLNKGNYGTAALESALTFAPYVPKGTGRALASNVKQGSKTLVNNARKFDINDINRYRKYYNPDFDSRMMTSPNVEFKMFQTGSADDILIANQKRFNEEVVPRIEKILDEKIARSLDPRGKKLIIQNEKEFLKSQGVKDEFLDELAEQAYDARIKELQYIKNNKSYRFITGDNAYAFSPRGIETNKITDSWLQTYTGRKPKKITADTPIDDITPEQFESFINLKKPESFREHGLYPREGVGLGFGRYFDANPIIAHELGHISQAQRYLPIENKLRHAAQPYGLYPGRLPNSNTPRLTLSDDLKTHYDYFQKHFPLHKRKTNEPYAFAHETKQLLLDYGFIKDWFDPVTEKTLIKARNYFDKYPFGVYDLGTNQYRTGTRMLDFTHPERYKMLAEELNKIAPAILPVAGAASLADYQKGGATSLSKYQTKGEVKHKWDNPVLQRALKDSAKVAASPYLQKILKEKQEWEAANAPADTVETSPTPEIKMMPDDFEQKSDNVGSYNNPDLYAQPEAPTSELDKAMTNRDTKAYSDMLNPFAIDYSYTPKVEEPKEEIKAETPTSKLYAEPKLPTSELDEAITNRDVKSYSDILNPFKNPYMKEMLPDEEYYKQDTTKQDTPKTLPKPQNNLDGSFDGFEIVDPVNPQKEKTDEDTLDSYFEGEENEFEFIPFHVPNYNFPDEMYNNFTKKYYEQNEKADAKMQELYYIITNPSVSQEEKDLAQKQFDDLKELQRLNVGQINSIKKRQAGVFDVLLQEEGPAWLSKGLQKIGFADDYSLDAPPGEKLYEDYETKAKRDYEQELVTKSYESLNTPGEANQWYRWKYRVNASNNDPLTVQLYGNRGERDKKDPNVKGLGAMMHFLDQSPLTGSTYWTTQNFYNRLSDDQYIGYLQKGDGDNYQLMYKKVGEIPKDELTSQNTFYLRTEDFDNINFDGERVKDDNFPGHTYWTRKNDGKQTIPISIGHNDNDYNYSSGNAVVYIFDYKGERRYIHFAGSPNAIRKEGERIKKDYNLKDNSLTIGIADAGSYASAVKADKQGNINNKLLNSKDYGYWNRNPYTGAGMVLQNDFKSGGEYMETELTPEEINWYLSQGYRVDELE